MKIQYTYEFKNDETITIDIDPKDYNVLVALDHEEYNLDRKHSRRYPISLEIALDRDTEERDTGRHRRRRPKTVNGALCDNPIAVDSADILGDIIKNQDKQVIRNAIRKLLPQQQELIFKVFYLERSIISIAKEEGVSEAAVRNRLKKIYANMKKHL